MTRQTIFCVVAVLILTAVIVGSSGCQVDAASQLEPKKPSIIGEWDVKMTFRDREFTIRLSFSEAQDGTLVGKWTSRRGTSELSDVKFDDGNLSFTRKRTYQGRERVSSYTGVVEGNNLILTSSGRRGERTFNAVRVDS